MRWLARKFDSLLGSAFAAVVALGTSQFLAFVQQYRQRLGGHLDEARLTQQNIETGASLQSLAPAARTEVLHEIAGRVRELEGSVSALNDAGLFARPVAFLQHYDRSIAAATLGDFQPALPLDVASLTYAAAGLFLGWLVYELLRSPVVLVARRRRPTAEKAKAKAPKPPRPMRPLQEPTLGRPAGPPKTK